MSDTHPLAADPVRRVRAMLRELDALPLPGSGATIERFRHFAQLGRDDLSLTRIAEGHVDARAILTELGRTDLLGIGAFGVWAAEPHLLHAEPTATGWRLHGTKGWCSGSTALDGALITATAPDGPRLFWWTSAEFAGNRVTVEPDSWTPLGMAATRSSTLHVDGVELTADGAVGDPNAYVDRPGFGHGGTGVAACWWGGALGLVDALERSLRKQDGDELAGAYGASTADLDATWALLQSAATEIDEHPHDIERAAGLASRTRLAVEAAAQRCIVRSIEVLGASGLCHDPHYAQHVADLTVYISQMRARPAAAAYGRSLVNDGGERRW